MWKTLAIGYGTAALVAVAAYSASGDGLPFWIAFVWLAGAPLTLAAAGLPGPERQHSVPLTPMPRHLTRPLVKRRASATLIR